MKILSVINKYLFLFGLLSVILLSCAANNDSLPPVRSDGLPSGQILTSEKTVTISLKTDEKSNCKYDIKPGNSYDKMTMNFAETKSKVHSRIIQLDSSKEYKFYVRCEDLHQNKNTDDYLISFQFTQADKEAPVRSNLKPVGTLAVGTVSTTISLITDEEAVCKYDENKDLSYTQKSKSFITNDNKNHSQNISNLANGKKYNFYIRCKDQVGNENSDDVVISFDIASDSADTIPPVRTNAQPTGVLPVGSKSSTISLETDENASCKYDLSSKNYEDMGFSFTTSDGLEHSRDISNLTDGANYNYFVRCKDAKGNENKDDFIIAFGVAKKAEPKPKKLPIGMNLDAVNYYSPSIPFNDVMKTAGEMFSYEIDNWDSWDSGKMEKIAVDKNGWPLALPYSEQNKKHGVRFLINNYYSGDYVLLYDGQGKLEVNGLQTYLQSGLTHIKFNGKGGDVWLDISESDVDNHIRNMRIIPSSYLNSEVAMPTFRQDYLKGLKPFHAIRFMDFSETNDSKQSQWSDRNTKDYYTQGNGRGVAWEYVIELTNELKTDAWICVPHQASDEYIKQLALLFKQNLNSDSKIYLEFSNELWNWIFDQSHYILDNAPNHPNSYVSTDLAAIGPAGEEHPEKDAYMMARLFRIFATVWGNDKSRLVRVATVQHAWVDNTRRILEYLFKHDGIGADALSPAGYFSYSEDDHEIWNAMNPAQVTADMILNSAWNKLDNPAIEDEADWTRASAKYAKEYNLDFVVYEGGQHMQPFEQGDWAYNHAVYDAQIDAKMYDLYMKNFAIHTEEAVDTKLFVAYSYISSRESQFGSWGHLENLEQLSRPSSLRQIAPKYQALLDINSR